MSSLPLRALVAAPSLRRALPTAAALPRCLHTTAASAAPPHSSSALAATHPPVLTPVEPRLGALTSSATPSFPATQARAFSAPPTTSSEAHERSPFSRHYIEHRVVPFSPRELYSVVADVDQYCSFVPWCNSSRVTRRIDDQHIIADLSVGFHLLSEQYTSVVTLNPYVSVTADVPNSSLFKYLATDWAFEAAGQHSTRLTFSVDFEFQNAMYQRVTDLFFEEVVKSMVGAFERQCFLKYRPSSDSSRPSSSPTMHRW